MASLHKSKKRFTKNDWIDLGSTLLREHGPQALTVETLCETAGKTRGSFYFHFETVDAFLTDIAQNWLYVFTNEIVANTPAPSSNRTDCLNLLAVRLDLELEHQIRKLALTATNTAEIVSQADELRINWLASLYEASGHYEKHTAQTLAQIEYAAFIGFKLVNPDLSPSDARELYNRFLEFTGRG